MKTIAIIGSAGIPAAYGGFETLVENITKRLSKNYNFIVFCQGKGKKEKIYKYNGAKLKYLPFYANGYQSVFYDIISIIISWFKYDSLLILGTGGCVILPVLKIIKRKKVILNIGGFEWMREKWPKYARIYLKFSEYIGSKCANIIIGDNQYICKYIKKEYHRRAVLIEYGGDNAECVPAKNDVIFEFPFLDGPYDVSISRAQPDNNLHILLEAYTKCPNRRLVLISNYHISNYGENIKKKYANKKNIVLQNAIYDINKLNIIRANASLYIHSHSLCGTAPSLVEAMSLGLPIIAFDVETNRYTTENKALYFKDVEGLYSIINKLNEDICNRLGAEMKKIAARRYVWDRIAKLYSEYF